MNLVVAVLVGLGFAAGASLPHYLAIPTTLVAFGIFAGIAEWWKLRPRRRVLIR